MNVKVMYETNRKTKVRCPNSFCKITHTVDGKITELWIKGESPGWGGMKSAASSFVEAIRRWTFWGRIILGRMVIQFA